MKVKKDKKDEKENIDSVPPENNVTTTDLEYMIATYGIYDNQAKKSILKIYNGMKYEDELIHDNPKIFNNKSNKLGSNALTTKHFNLNSIKSENIAGEKIFLSCYIHSIDNPHPIPHKDKRVSVTKATLIDKNGNTINSLYLPYDGIGSKVEKLFNSHQRVIVTGAVISIIQDSKFGDPESLYKFYIARLWSAKNIYDIINFANHENISNFLPSNSVKPQINLFTKIKNDIVSNMNISGLNEAEELDLAIDFMIYQAFSYGLLKNTSMKLNSLIIGAPGSGKKLLTNIAMGINAIAEEVSAGDGKVTMAGLVGNVVNRGNKKISEPGYFSLASGGVLCIQDFHEIKSGRKTITGCFSKVMEDGEIIDSTSARTIHKSVTSIHLDTNKYSQVRDLGPTPSLADIDIPNNVITRFDFIIDILPDFERQWKVALDMTRNPNMNQGVVNDWKQDLKENIALANDSYEIKEISDEVTKYKILKMEELKNEYINKFDDINEWQGLFTRLAISIDKYLYAISCCHREEISKEHVDIALKFIRPKFDYVSSLTIGEKKLSSQEERQNIIRNNFPIGTEFTKHEALVCLEKEDIFISDRTLDRFMKKLLKEGKADKSRHGFWKMI